MSYVDGLLLAGPSTSTPGLVQWAWSVVTFTSTNTTVSSIKGSGFFFLSKLIFEPSVCVNIVAQLSALGPSSNRCSALTNHYSSASPVINHPWWTHREKFADSERLNDFTVCLVFFFTFHSTKIIHWRKLTVCPGRKTTLCVCVYPPVCVFLFLVWLYLWGHFAGLH